MCNIKKLFRNNFLNSFTLVSLRAFFAKQSFKEIASAQKRPRNDTGWFSIAQVLLFVFFDFFDRFFGSFCFEQ